MLPFQQSPSREVLKSVSAEHLSTTVTPSTLSRSLVGRPRSSTPDESLAFSLCKVCERFQSSRPSDLSALFDRFFSDFELADRAKASMVAILCSLASSSGVSCEKAGIKCFHSLFLPMIRAEKTREFCFPFVVRCALSTSNPLAVLKAGLCRDTAPMLLMLPIVRQCVLKPFLLEQFAGRIGGSQTATRSAALLLSLLSCWDSVSGLTDALLSASSLEELLLYARCLHYLGPIGDSELLRFLSSFPGGLNARTAVVGVLAEENSEEGSVSIRPVVVEGSPSLTAAVATVVSDGAICWPDKGQKIIEVRFHREHLMRGLSLVSAMRAPTSEAVAPLNTEMLARELQPPLRRLKSVFAARHQRVVWSALSPTLAEPPSPEGLDITAPTLSPIIRNLSKDFERFADGDGLLSPTFVPTSPVAAERTSNLEENSGVEYPTELTPAEAKTVFDVLTKFRLTLCDIICQRPKFNPEMVAGTAGEVCNALFRAAFAKIGHVGSDNAEKVVREHRVQCLRTLAQSHWLRSVQPEWCWQNVKALGRLCQTTTEARSVEWCLAAVGVLQHLDAFPRDLLEEENGPSVLAEQVVAVLSSLLHHKFSSVRLKVLCCIRALGGRVAGVLSALEENLFCPSPSTMVPMRDLCLALTAVGTAGVESLMEALDSPKIGTKSVCAVAYALSHCDLESGSGSLVNSICQALDRLVKSQAEPQARASGLQGLGLLRARLRKKGVLAGGMDTAASLLDIDWWLKLVYSHLGDRSQVIARVAGRLAVLEGLQGQHTLLSALLFDSKAAVRCGAVYALAKCSAMQHSVLMGLVDSSPSVQDLAAALVLRIGPRRLSVAVLRSEIDLWGAMGDVEDGTHLLHAHTKLQTFSSLVQQVLVRADPGRGGRNVLDRLEEQQDSGMAFRLRSALVELSDRLEAREEE